MKMSRIAAAAVFMMAGTGFAQTTVNSGTFNVTVSLTPVCAVKTNATDVDFGTYTPFTNAAVPLTRTVVFRCSQGITPTSIGLVSTAGTNVTTSTAGTGAQTAEGVIRGLRYTLGIPSLTDALTAGTAGQVATAGTGGTGGNNSTAKEYSFQISANMPGGQAGGVGGDTSHTWRLDLVY